MAIGADDMARGRIDGIFHGRMRLGIERDGVDARFLEIGGDVFVHRRAVVTDQAILFGRFRLQEMARGICVMRQVTILAAESLHGGGIWLYGCLAGEQG